MYQNTTGELKTTRFALALVALNVVNIFSSQAERGEVGITFSVVIE
jgi:hypothetical protein